MAKALAAVDPEAEPASYPGLRITPMGRGILELQGEYQVVFRALISLCGYSEDEAAQAITGE